MLCRIVEQSCSAIVSKVLKQRANTVAKATDVCMAFVEQDQGEPMLVKSRELKPQARVIARPCLSGKFSAAAGDV